MSEKTAIQWTDHTWNPWVGCRKVSPGCANCYAESLMQRFGRDFSKRTRTKDWRKPVLWNKGAEKSVKLDYVFPSLCDPFDPEVPLDWFNDFMVLVDKTRNLTWQLLTKRPEYVMPRWKQVCGHWGRTDLSLPPNVWIGASVEDQQRAYERIPELQKIPAKVRFLSCEPLLAPIKFRTPADLLGVHWVIIGGESGPKARPCNVDWIRDIVRQCGQANVPVFVKQLGAHIIDYQCVSANPVPDSLCWPLTARGDEAQRRIYLKHPKGGDPEEWPLDLCVREMPKS